MYSFGKIKKIRLNLNESGEGLGQRGKGRSFQERGFHSSEAVDVIHNTFVKMEGKFGFISTMPSSEISKLSQTKNKRSRTPLHTKHQHSAQASAHALAQKVLMVKSDRDNILLASGKPVQCYTHCCHIYHYQHCSKWLIL